jgi:TonB family protein
VVEARPLGRVDVATPGYLALVSAEFEARFEIASDGTTTDVTLVPGTGVTAVDAEVVAFLKTVRWSPKTVGGIAVADVQTLTISKDAR